MKMKVKSVFTTDAAEYSRSSGDAQRKLAPDRSRRWRLRRFVLFLHLGAGLAAAPFVAVMSITGIAIAFEQEILGFIDAEASRAEAPGASRPRSIDALLDALDDERPGFGARSVTVHRDPEQAHVVVGRGGATVFLNPHTGEATDQPSESAHEIMHFLEDLHRFLAFGGDAEPVGRFILGTANLALVFLCLSGLYLWFPRNWAKRALRPLFVLVRTRGERAKQFNRHAVFGFWSLPVLLVVTASAVTFSFAWAHELVFALAGEEPPASRGFAMLAVPPADVPPPSGEPRLSLESVRSRLVEAYPDHESLVFFLPSSGADAAGPKAPLDVHVLTPDLFSTRGRTFVQIDPYRGDVLSSVAFADRPPGLRARVWLRFLHTGEAFGLAGTILATLATAASLVLVYTGVVLSWRRFTKKRRRPARPPVTAP